MVPTRGVRAGFAVGYHGLDHDHRHLFRLIALLDGSDIDAPVAAALADVPQWRAEALLDELCEARLTESHTPGRHRMHDLLRLFARERALEEDAEAERRQAIRRGLHCYLATARAAARLANSRHPWRLDLNRGDGPTLTVVLAAALYSVLTVRGRWTEVRVIGERAVNAAASTGHSLHQAVAHQMLGDANSNLGLQTEAIAHMCQALLAFRSLDDTRSESAQLGRIAIAYARSHRFEEAIDRFHEALALDRGQGDRMGEGMNLTNLGVVFRRWATSPKHSVSRDTPSGRSRASSRPCG
ncbi:hypothetical protein OHA25_52725 [Nonomuraea sp. NBC_00507]|uniref:hypothetical protein n=1 Tax=Nonomuraea sp. NBC_00507 TaxID=2976002 RepID=UPI002E196843